LDAALIVLQGLVVIGAILLGVRTGRIGLGLWGFVGLAVTQNSACRTTNPSFIRRAPNEAIRRLCR